MGGQAWLPGPQRCQGLKQRDLQKDEAGWATGVACAVWINSQPATALGSAGKCLPAVTRVLSKEICFDVSKDGAEIKHILFRRGNICYLDPHISHCSH